MNGIKTEDLFIEASVDVDDGDNMPRNLARYARSSYSRKELEEEAEALIMDTEAVASTSVPLPNHSPETPKGDKVVKKIKEELMIRQIKDEKSKAEITKGKNMAGCDEANTIAQKAGERLAQKIQAKDLGQMDKIASVCSSPGASPTVLSNNYENGVEEPEDEVVSYKTETDQDSIRTDSRASEVSSTNSINLVSGSNVHASALANGIGKVLDAGDSIIVRDHDDSSSSICNDDLEEQVQSDSRQSRKSKRNAKDKTLKGRGLLRNTSENPMVTDERCKIESPDTKSSKQSEQTVGIDMSPTVIIKELDLTSKSTKTRVALSSKAKPAHSKNIAKFAPSSLCKTSNQNNLDSKIATKAVVTEKGSKQQTINAYFSPSSKTTVNNIVGGPESTHANNECIDISNHRGRRRSLRPKLENELSGCDGPNKSKRHDCTESESSEVESEKIDIPATDESLGVYTSKSGRSIGKPKYVYESSSEHASETESSRTASPALGLRSPFVHVTLSPSDIEDRSRDQTISTDKMKYEEEEIVGTDVEESDEMDRKENLNADLPCKYSVGELAWARVGTAPFWPCTFTYDPDLKIHSYITRVQAARQANRQYHVQFFGKVQRAWVKEQGVISYEGLEAFNDAGRQLKMATATRKIKQKEKHLNAYFPTGNTRITWQSAVDEMLQTTSMDSEQRLDHVKNLFETSVRLAEEKREKRALDKKQNKRKREESGSSMTSSISSVSTNISAVSPPNKRIRATTEEEDSEDGSGTEPLQLVNIDIKNELEATSLNVSLPLKKRVCQSQSTKLALPDDNHCLQPVKLHPRFPEADRLIRAIPTTVLEDNRRKLKTGFKLFQIANSETVRSLPLEDKGSEDLEKTLSRMWNGLSFPERRFYQDMIRSLVSQFEEEDNNSICSEEHEGTFILDSEDEAFKDDDDDKESVVSAKNRNSKEKKPGFSTPPSSLYPSEQSSPDMVGVFKKEFCCIICEELVSPLDMRNKEQKEKNTNRIVKCRGGCHNTYHLGCLGEENVAKLEEWKCKECRTGQHPCFICKTAETKDETLGSIEKCSQAGCGKYFHRSCLKKYNLWPQARYAEHALTCPGHICHTCASDNPKDPYMKYNTKLLKCIRCPTTYHSGDHCVAAGSVQITMTQIICPKHFSLNSSGSSKNGKKSGGKGHTGHFNANWCFICSKGGDLICCERCPASFHKECLADQLDGDVLPEKYYCDNCETGRMPLYGEILWVKLGVYRWWPAQVIHPANLPSNIERLRHDIGEFPIQFCGTNEYYWMNQGRCFLYEEGDAEGKNAGKNAAIFGNVKTLNASFRRGLVEAAELFEAFTAERTKREAANAVKANTGWQKHVKPPLYTKIKYNQPVGDCPVYKIAPLDQQNCECDPNSEEPCGENSECLNRLLLCECRPSTCPAGEKCNNQRFQRRSYPKLRVTRTASRGWGLTLHQEVKKGTFIIEYVGELITMAEFHSRIERSILRNEEHNYYYMTMDGCRMIDAGPKGNIARFMNHSCDPNCETQKWTVNGDTKVGLFAVTDIPDGTELTFNYQFEVMGDVKQKCLCGGTNCSGFIGEKPDPVPSRDGKVNGDKSTKGAKQNMGEEKEKSGKKKKKPKKLTKTWEDICFRCYEEGQLLMCDWKNCPKVYHLACLGREKMPREKWFCPWHHCVTCGKPAASYCIHCPNAYCSEHNSVIFHHPELGRICDEHEEDIEHLIEFYRKVEGGVSTLVPHPNISLHDAIAKAVKGDRSNLVDDENAAESSGLTEDNVTSFDAKRLRHNDSYSNDTVETGTPNSIDTDVEQASIMNSDVEIGEEEWLEQADISDPDVLKKIISATKVSLKTYKCGELGCPWNGKKQRLAVHYEKIHHYSKENSEKLTSLAVELAIRRREEAASKAKRLSLEIQMAQLSKSPKKSLEAIQLGNTSNKVAGLVSKGSAIANLKSDFSTALLEKATATKSPVKSDVSLSASLKTKGHNTFSSPSNITDPSSSSPSKVEMLYMCPVCKWALRGSLFWRHITKKHPGHEIDKENIVKVEPGINQNTGKASLKAKPMYDSTDDESLRDNNEGDKIQPSGENHQPGKFPTHSTPLEKRRKLENRTEEQGKSNSAGSSDRRLSGISPRIMGSVRSNGKKKLSTRTTAENEKAFSPGHSLCSECGKFVHSSNTARHWRSQHPQLHYSPRKFSHNQNRLEEDMEESESSLGTVSTNLFSEQEHSKENINVNDSEDLANDPILHQKRKSQDIITRSSRRVKEGPKSASFVQECKRSTFGEGNAKDKDSSLSQAVSDNPTLHASAINKFNNGGQGFAKTKCGYPGCNFSSVSGSALKSHRQLMNHPRHPADSSPEKSKTHALAKKFKQRAISKILNKDAKSKLETGVGVLLSNGMPRKWRSCDFEGCDYRTQYKANLNRHQKQYGHIEVESKANEEIQKESQKLLVSDSPSCNVTKPLTEIDLQKKCLKGKKIVEVFENRSIAVIGRDRDGNDVMADGSIKLKSVLSSPSKLTNKPSPKPTTQQDLLNTDHGGFDITACVGSPEKLPTEESESIVQADETPAAIDAPYTSNSLAQKTFDTQKTCDSVAVKMPLNPLSAKSNAP